MAKNDMKFIVWERLNKTGKWCPFTSEISHLLEASFKKNLDDVCLGDADENLKIYSVNLKDLVQTSQTTGTKSTVRRSLYDCSNSLCNGFTWQWCDDQNVWHTYDVEVNSFIEKAFLQGVRGVALKKTFRGYNYEVDFSKMSQMNKQTKRKRTIRRNQSISPYPSTTTQCPDKTKEVKDATVTVRPAYELSELAKEVPGTDALVHQVNQYMMNVKRTYSPEDGSNSPGEVVSIQNASQSGGFSNVSDNQSGSCLASPSKHTTTVAMVNGHPWYDYRPPHTPQSKLKPVPGIDPLPKCGKKPRKKKAKRRNAAEVEPETGDVLEEYTIKVERELKASEDDDCIICCEPLSGGSSYDGDATVVQLKFCPHIFHRSCLLAMYNSGSKDNCLQCPVCKKIHGVKCGIQPAGDMIYHVLPYSLPSYSECDTIRIIYDIPPGTQGPEHPNPGKKYSNRGFPRHCYLPDNEMGRKVLRLLVKAWKRRLIFTIGRSSTTGEENTVTWNEIHHKTEFGFNRGGHGYPDPNYFDNVLSELEAQGVKDDDVFLWYPA